MADCPHGMPSIKSCVDCMMDEGIPPDPKPKRTVEYTFRAKYDGHCGECNTGIHVGQEAAKLSNGQVVHDSCAPGEWVTGGR